ncbi:MAG: hypothetical protein N2Z73_04715, partial [Endomicrobia bacterium]|nr:hypothetical protein [Endomicrobiia bacterium]
MSFYVKDVIDKVRSKVAEEDPINSFFSNSMIISCINDCLLTLCRDLELTNRRITISTIPGQMEYELPSNVVEVNRVWFERDNIRYEVKYTEWDDFLNNYDDNNKSDILYVYYLRNNYDADNYKTYIGFYPLPSKTINVMLDVLVRPYEIQQENDVINLHINFKDLLVMLVLSELYERDKRYD